MSFASRIKQLASETAIYGISSVLARLVNFLLFPFYSQVFPPDRYGVVSLVYASFIFLNILYQYGMESAYLKYASDAEDEGQSKGVFSTATLSLFGTSLVFTGAMVLFKEPVAGVLGLEAQWYSLLYYAALILLLDALAIVPFAALRLASKPWRFALIRFAGVLTNVGLNVLLILAFDMGIEAVFIANAAASGVMLLLLAPTYAANFRLAFDGGTWRALLRFGLPFIPGGLGYAVTERINYYFLEDMSPTRVEALYGDEIGEAAMTRLAERSAEAETSALDQALEAGLSATEAAAQAAEAASGVYGDYVVGVYGGVLKLAIFMALVVQMFRYAWQPFFLQRADDDDAKPLFGRIFALFTAVMITALLAVSFFARELVAIPLPGGRFLVQPQYWLGLSVVPVALLGYLFQGWYYTFTAGAYIEKKTSYFVPCTLAGSALTLALNIWLVPTYGMIAAAWATTAAYALMALSLWLLTRRFYPVPYPWGRVAAMGAIGLALFFAWNEVAALQRWYVEALLLVAFLGGLIAVRIVPLDALKKLLRRGNAKSG
jgi:O-antigen/teichoic acid export membrane protein